MLFSNRREQRKLQAGRTVIYIIALVCLWRTGLFADENSDSIRGRLRGKVIDENTQQSLQAANVMIEGTDWGAAADKDGEYIIEHIMPGVYNVRVMMMGYETRLINNVVINPGRTTWQKVELKSTVVSTDGVVVTAGFFHEARDAVVSNRSVDYEEIRSDPGSAADIQRVMQTLPSVVSGADQDNEIIVRGGMYGENLFVMDNIEIPNPNHFAYQGAGGGPINMINSNFVRRVDFYAGAFPARYGDKASSVMDISLREGDRERMTGHGYLGMSGAGLILEGPLFNGKGSYLLSGQKSFLDLIISSTGLTAVPHYYSFQGKVVYDLNPSHKLILNGLYGNDEIHIEEEEEGSAYDRGAENVKSMSHQYAFGATWRFLFSDRGYSKFTLSQTLNHWNQYVYWSKNKKPYYTNVSTETERTAKLDVVYQLSKRFEMNLGGQVKSIPFNINIWSDADTIFYYGSDPVTPDSVFQAYDVYEHLSEETTYKAAGYGQIKWRPVSRLTATLGLRYDYFGYTRKAALDPRVGFSCKVADKTTLNLAFGQHSQSPAYIQITAHPENDDLDYKKTRQVVFGIEHLFKDDMRGTVELFYKDYDHVPISESQLSPNPFDAAYGRLVNEGEGFAKGVEFFLQKKMTGNYHFTFSYAYSVSKGRDPRYGTTFNWDFDYRHIFTFLGGWHWDLRNRNWYKKMKDNFFYKLFAWFLPFGDQVEVGLRWRYLGGRPFTQRTYYPFLRTWAVEEDTPLNAERYPAYHRLDIRLDRRFMFRKWNIVTFLDVFNIYQRDNIWGYTYNDDGTIDKILQFQVFPVGGLTIEF